MRGAKNTPTIALTVLETMHLRSLLIAAALAALSFPAWAACEAPEGCPDSAPVLVASAEPAAAAAVQIAQLPAEVVPALAPGDAGTATARVSASLSEGRPASLVMRPEAASAGARASAGERGAEQRSAPGSEPSSAWLMVFAGLAFAGFVVAKRSKS
jgi:hypothetical protein